MLSVLAYVCGGMGLLPRLSRTAFCCLSFFSPPQDVACPYMLDPRHPSDTFFLVAEADMRFYQRDEVPAAEWLTAAGEGALFDAAAVDAGRARLPRDPLAAPEAAGASAARSSWEPSPSPACAAPGTPPSPSQAGDPSLSPGHAAAEPQWPGTQMGEPSAGQKRGFGAWQAGLRTELPDAAPVTTTELKDLVHIATQADRLGVGDMIWYSWCGGSKKRKAHPAHGSHLLGFSRTGAREFLEVLTREAPAHADVVLRNACCAGEVANSCYVYPAIGSFATHLSGVERGSRPSEWEASYVQEGVRPQPGQKQRWLARFAARGPVQWIEPPLTFGSDVNVWRTRRPPSGPYADVELWRTILSSRGWLGRDGTWLGPRKGTGRGGAATAPQRRGRAPGAEPFAGKSAGKRKRGTFSEYDVFRDDPAALMGMAGHAQPISVLASEVVTDPENFHWGSGHSQRLWSQRRHAIRLYKHRVFTDRDEEAGEHAHKEPFLIQRRASHVCMSSCLQGSTEPLTHAAACRCASACWTHLLTKIAALPPSVPV